jgi:hypothetical protein
MAPDFSMRFGGGQSVSGVHPVVVGIAVVAAVLIFVLPRKYVIVPVLLTIFLTPFGQQFYIAGTHVFITRILILCGLIRIACTNRRTQTFAGGFNSIDKVFLAWAIVRAVCTVLEFLQTQAIINQCGFLWDTIGGYVLFRFLIRDKEDIVRAIKTFALIVCVFAVTMTGERLFLRNAFGYIGGAMTPSVREGAIRAQGTFEGPIRCGTFGAALLCLFAWLWRIKRSRLAAIAGLTGATVMVVTSASSTPLLTYIAFIIGISMWPLRKHMRRVRWGLVIFLVLLQFVMKAPVWFAINHVDLIAGNSGYHRAMLIDQCVRHFGDWWLIGAQTTATWYFEMSDQCNQFVSEAENGGLATFILFMMIITRCLSRVGNARKLAVGNRNEEWLIWLLGASVFAYIVSFFGINFASQEAFAWFALIAMICAATTKVTQMKPKARAELAIVNHSFEYDLPSARMPSFR